MFEDKLIQFYIELDAGGTVIESMQGASGAVYIIDKGEGSIPRKIAYKTIRVDKIDDKKKKHFIEECEIWLKIQSNYIATAFCSKVIEDNLFIVMPYFELSLQSLLTEVAEGKKSITYLDALVITCKITKALIELKNSDIKYHQDFNPPNILIQLLDKKIENYPKENYLNYDIKIADFGIANLRERIGPTTGGGGGKFPYKAPEQYYPKKYEVYNPDVFALGIMIYMIFSGKHPSGVENQKALKKKTSERKFKSWILSEDKNIEPLSNPILNDYINRMLKNDPAARTDLDDFYSFILGELKKENRSVYTQLGGFFNFRDVFDTKKDKIDRLYRLNKVAGLPKLEAKVFDEFYTELNDVKSKLSNLEDVIYYSELIRYLNRFFQKGYLQDDQVKKEYRENVRIWHKWYKKMKIANLYKFRVQYEGLDIIDLTKGLREYEAANEYISCSIQYLLESEDEKEVKFLFEGFDDNVFLSYFFYNRALDLHQRDIYKSLEFLSKAKECHPSEALFYCNEGKWIKQFLNLYEYKILSVPYELSKTQKEELALKMRSAFTQCNEMGFDCK